MSKKSKSSEGNQIQSIINKKLKELIDMSVFIKKESAALVPNTFGVTCPNCKVKDKVYAETVQLRSGDEAADRLCTCLNCGYNWRIRGG